MTERKYADPPGMPEDERMTPAELRVVREFLGLSSAALAGYLGVTDRTVRHWEAGKYPVPDGVRIEIEKLEAYTARFVADVVERLLDIPDPVVVTYRTDEEYHEAHPEIPLPASWHRAVVARVAQEVPALSIVYASDIPKTAQQPHLQ